MKISIASDKPVQNSYLKSLDYQIHDFTLDKEFDIQPGWYELMVEYVDTKIEIQDILVDGSSLREFIYTGYYTDGNGTVHQPATAVWDKGGVFSIWIHTDIGFFFQRTLETIKTGDFGKNLFETYTLTVDRPVHARDGIYPAHITTFFSNAHGPQWWEKGSLLEPWRKCAIPDIDIDLLLSELEKVCLQYKTTRGNPIWKLKENSLQLPFVELDDIGSDIVRDFLSVIGYKRVINISIMKLDPGKYIDMHIDDYYDHPAYPYIKGCKKFYWTCKNPDGVHFKLGRSGVLPHHEPLFINTIEHSHALINEGDKTRTSILVYGDIEH